MKNTSTRFLCFLKLSEFLRKLCPVAHFVGVVQSIIFYCSKIDWLIEGPVPTMIQAVAKTDSRISDKN